MTIHFNLKGLLIYKSLCRINVTLCYGSLEVLSAHSLVTLALLKHVHVVLAHADVVSRLLQAVDEIHVEALALVLLCGGLFLSGLALVVCIGSRLLLNLLLLLSLLGGLTSMATSSTAHKSTDSLVGNLRAGTKGHARHQGTSKATHHSTSGSWCLSRCCWGCSCGSSWCRSWWCCCLSRWSSREESATS